uniref:Uncharacterized protein n=1 Tax=Arabidopsis thaliana TaxID=3702 RepID=Q0WM75_ARATH|nr:hypothetical protein [Arabidopsis thaliana]
MTDKTNCSYSWSLTKVITLLASHPFFFFCCLLKRRSKTYCNLKIMTDDNRLLKPLLTESNSLQSIALVTLDEEHRLVKLRIPCFLLSSKP